MNVEDLERLEQTFDFHYPALYKQLCADGMLYCGEFSPLWFKNEYPKYRERPSLLLFGFDFEILYPKEIEKEICYFRETDYFLKEFHLIPFGQNGAGDKYCFYTDKEVDGQMPVVFAPHDEMTAKIYARNLQDAIFRNMLEAVSYCDLEDESEKEQLPDILQMLVTHLPYLTDRQQKIITEVYARQPQSYQWVSPNGRYTENYASLMKREDLEELLKQEIGFPELDHEFIYMS